MTVKANEITVGDYLAIRKDVNWKKLSEAQAKLALANSLYAVGVYDGEKLVGMGRLVGDGAVICYVQDLIVLPQYQNRGIGSTVLNALAEYVESLRQPGSQMMFGLMCAKGREAFYEKHGFTARPTKDLGPGMIQYLQDDQDGVLA